MLENDINCVGANAYVSLRADECSEPAGYKRALSNTGVPPTASAMVTAEAKDVSLIPGI